MNDIRWTGHPELARPVLVVAFEGLFDIGEAATSSVHWLNDRWPTYQVASIDPERFFDFTQQRPEISVDEHGRRIISWPDNRCSAVRPSTSGAGSHDLLLLAGIEPHLRWRQFCGHIASIAGELGVEMVVTLGASPGRQPHSRPFRITSSSTNAELARRLGVGRPSYQGPTGVVGVLHDTLDKVGLPVISLRTAVPPYVVGSPNPKARQALLRHLGNLLAIDTGHELDEDQVQAWLEQVEEALAADPDADAFVRQLEADFDRSYPDADEALGRVDGDDLAAEVEAFLRDENTD